MKANEALNLLRISRKTLHVYAEDGKIRYIVMPYGMYDYNDDRMGTKTNSSQI